MALSYYIGLRATAGLYNYVNLPESEYMRNISLFILCA